MDKERDELPALAQSPASQLPQPDRFDGSQAWAGISQSIVRSASVNSDESTEMTESALSVASYAASDPSSTSSSSSRSFYPAVISRVRRMHP